MKKLKNLHTHFVNWYMRIIERLGIVQGDITYTTRQPRASFTFKAGKRATPLWILEDMLYHDPYNDESFLIRDNPTIIDLGANLGFFSILEAKRFPTARIFAYEAHPANYAYLMHNSIQNKTEGQIVAVHAAVVGTPTASVRIYEHDDDVGSHSLVSAKEGLSGRSQEVPAITFADVLQTHALTHVDLLKMDIEGGEYDIVRNSAQTLQKVRYLALEHHVVPGETVDDLRAMLTACGFEVREHSSHIWHCSNLSLIGR